MIAFARPRLYGDAGEYFLMLQSFSNHQSFELREKDWKDLETIMRQEEKFSDVRKWGRLFPYGGYYKSLDGRYYCYHFWVYPLLTYPVKVVLHFAGGIETRAFQIFNAFLIGLLSILAVLMSKQDPPGGLIVTLLFLFNPALWYVHWPHPEIFSYFCVSLSLLAYLNQRYLIAVFFSSLASTQNSPISMLTFFYILRLYTSAVRNYGWDLKKQISLVLKVSACFLPTLLPYVFYYSHYRKWSLIQSAGFADLSLISLRRICEQIFDPNIGIFPYMPGILVVYGLGVFYSVYMIARTLFTTRSLRDLLDQQTGSIEVLGLSLVLLAELAISSAATNWNHGSSGPARYLIWSAVPISVATISIILSKRKSLLLEWTLLITFLLNLSIVTYGGLLIPSRVVWYTEHSYLSKIVLDRFPAIYNPTPEIFVERTSRKSERGKHRPVVYRAENGSCKKALLRMEEHSMKALKRQCGAGYTLDRCEKTGECYVSFQ